MQTINPQILALIPYAQPRIRRAGTYRLGHDLARMFTARTGKHA